MFSETPKSNVFSGIYGKVEKESLVFEGLRQQGWRCGGRAGGEWVVSNCMKKTKNECFFICKLPLSKRISTFQSLAFNSEKRLRLIIYIFVSG